jgi:hypothetical protein
MENFIRSIRAELQKNEHKTPTIANMTKTTSASDITTLKP